MKYNYDSEINNKYRAGVVYFKDLTNIEFRDLVGEMLPRLDRLVVDNHEQIDMHLKRGDYYMFHFFKGVAEENSYMQIQMTMAKIFFKHCQ